MRKLELYDSNVKPIASFVLEDNEDPISSATRYALENKNLDLKSMTLLCNDKPKCVWTIRGLWRACEMVHRNTRQTERTLGNRCYASEVIPFAELDKGVTSLVIRDVFSALLIRLGCYNFLH